jgi:hypothetical protein
MDGSMEVWIVVWMHADGYKYGLRDEWTNILMVGWVGVWAH